MDVIFVRCTLTLFCASQPTAFSTAALSPEPEAGVNRTQDASEERVQEPVACTSMNWLPFPLPTWVLDSFRTGAGVTGTSFSQDTVPRDSTVRRAVPRKRNMDLFAFKVVMVMADYSNSTVIFSIRTWPLFAWRTTLEADPVHVTVRADLSAVAEAPPSRPVMSKQ